MSKKRYEMSKPSMQKELKVKKKGIKYLTVNMLNMNLQHLDLTFNNIEHLPDELCQLSHLYSLHLDHNNIRHLPHDLGLLTRLRYLSVCYNDLRALPDSVGNCTKLVELSISDNQIKVVPAAIGECRELRTLQLHSNKIVLIPSSMAELGRLDMLSLEWFLYMSPQQQLLQSGPEGTPIIQQFLEFCAADILMQRSSPSSSEGHSSKCFLDFLSYFYVCKPKKTKVLTANSILDMLASTKFQSKGRCIASVVIQNKHAHLLQELINSKYPCVLTELVNRNINLNVFDFLEYSPFLLALRQESPDYASILLQTTSLMPLDINLRSPKNGYLLH